MTLYRRARESARLCERAVDDKNRAVAAHVHDQEKLKVQIQEINDLEFKLERERHRTTKLTGQLTAQQSLHARALENASTGKSVVDLASVIGVSPNKMAKVVNASKRGSLSTELMDNAETNATNCDNKPAFLKRVAATLTPLVEHFCAIPKFKSGQSDMGGVASMILGKIARKKSSKCKRRLNYGRPKQVTPELDTVLKELAVAWRTAFRDHDRDLSARLLQLTLKTIPAHSGVVTQWLGPR